MITKTTFLTWLFAIVLFSPTLLKAQDTPPANAKVISVTTSTDATIKLYIKTASDNTPVWIETSSGNFIKKLIGTSWDNSDYTVSGTSLKVHGDVTAFTVANQEAKVTALDISQNTALKELYCYNNSISTLDVSQNTALTRLYCHKNSISTLDVSNNTALTRLYCFNNNLSSLDVSQNTALVRLDCSNNNLSSLDVSQNTALTRLYCYNSNLSTLDVSNNTALTHLYSFSNSLSTLDISKNIALKRLDCSHNNLNSIDVSQNTALQRLHCQNNGLTKLNVANGNNSNFKSFGLGRAFDATNNPNLQCIQIDENFTPPTTGGDKWLKDAAANWSTDCGYAQDTPPANAKVISVTTSTDATIKLYLKATTYNAPVWIETSSGNFIKKLIGTSWDASDYTVSGTSLKVYGDVTYFGVIKQIEKVTALDISQNTALKELYCYNNSISTLDVSQSLDLTYLNCSKNSLSTLDVSKNTALTYLNCSKNSLSALDVSKNTALTQLYCYSNILTTLDVSQNTALTQLHCHSNILSALDVSKNTALTELYCHYNNLGSLDVSQNRALTYLSCFSCGISSLDVSNNTALIELFCHFNNISTLDVSQNSKLQALHCQGNSLIKLNVANGNNVNFIGYLGGTAFDATSNPNLQCIQIDHRFTPPTTGENKWLKDNTANWSTNCNVSTNDIEENQSFVKVYPNPAKDFVTVSGLSEGQLTKIEVFGMAGEKVMELSTNQAQVRVSLAVLSIGNYVIRISNEEQNQSFKLIKK